MSISEDNFQESFLFFFFNNVGPRDSSLLRFGFKRLHPLELSLSHKIFFLKKDLNLLGIDPLHKLACLLTDEFCVPPEHLTIATVVIVYICIHIYSKNWQLPYNTVMNWIWNIMVLLCEDFTQCILIILTPIPPTLPIFTLTFPIPSDFMHLKIIYWVHNILTIYSWMW